MEDIEIIKEFLIESSENLARLDLDLVELEKRPRDAALLASVFRTIHTIKGTCGFLNFRTLERITHLAENLLSQVRNGERELTPELVSLTLEAVDSVKRELASIEASGAESGDSYVTLVQRQQAAYAATSSDATGSASATGSMSATDSASATGSASATSPNSATTTLSATSPAEATPKPNKPKIEFMAAAAPSAQISAPAPPPTAPSADSESSGATQRSVSAADSTIRVDVGLLDKLMNLVGELVLARNQILQFNMDLEDPRLGATSQRLNLITRELQENVMKTRMQPIGTVWNKLPRVVRDLAAACGKQIALEMEGSGTELDKTIIEAIKDPLTHIVRNSCDHGIETPEQRVRAGKSPQGTLRLSAFHEGGNVNIEIADDGGGISPQIVKAKAIQKGLIGAEAAERLSPREVVNLVFLPGFSTAGQVSNISGRGVGMDVVKTNIEKIGGSVDLQSRPGEGATIKIRIPLTLAIIPGMVVSSGGERFVIPQGNLVDLVRVANGVRSGQIERVQGATLFRRRGALLPLLSLNGIMGLATPPEAKLEAKLAESDDEVTNIVVVQAEERHFGLIVDAINDTQEIVVKPLGKQLKNLACYSGATIMGDGRVALILDVPGIARLSSVLGASRAASRPAANNSDCQTGERENELQKLLLFQAGPHERLAVPLSLVTRLEEVGRARIERSGANWVLHYRDEILSLLQLPGGAPHGELPDPVQIIVFTYDGHRVGLVVGKILDIVEESLTVKKPSTQPGLLGSALVGGKVTDFLDMHALIQSGETAWFSNPARQRRGASVLIAEESSFLRGILRSSVELGGYRVIEAANHVEARAALARGAVDAVAVSLDLPDSGASELTGFLRKTPSLASIPVLALSTGSAAGDAAGSTAGNAASSAAGSESFHDCVAKLDREAMLASLDRLSAAIHATSKREVSARVA